MKPCADKSVLTCWAMAAQCWLTEAHLFRVCLSSIPGKKKKKRWTQKPQNWAKMGGVWEIPSNTPAYLECTWRGGWAGNGWSLGICWTQKTGLWCHPGQPIDCRDRTLAWLCLLFQKTAYSFRKYTGVNSSMVPLEWSQRKVCGWVGSVETPGQEQVLTKSSPTK